MRIALIGPSRHPLSQPFHGGQEAHTAMLARELRAQGHYVRLYAGRGTPEGLADELVVHPETPPLSVTAASDVNLPEPGFLSDHHAYVSVIADLLRRPDIDVIHNNSLNHLPLSMSSALTTPVLTTLHTPPFPWMEVGSSLAGEGTRFVAVSAALASLWTTVPQPIDVIHNGVMVEEFPAGPGGPDLVHVGRLTPEKGADIAIEAARRAGRRLNLVGPISDPAWFEAVIAPRLGPDAVHLGHLDHVAVADVVGASSAALVTPQWEEPFGLVAVEAALTGTPVVAVARGGLPEVITAEIGVLVQPGEGVESRIADALGAAEALTRARVRAEAVKRYTVTRMVEEYVALYREIALSP